MTEPAGPVGGPERSRDQMRLSDEVSVLWILAALLRGRRALLAFGGVGAAIAVLIALLQAPRYTSSFSFLPQSTLPQGTDGLASLAGQFGISLGGLRGQTESPQLYAELLKSREVLSVIAGDSIPQGMRQIALSEFLGVTGLSTAFVEEKTIRLLREKVISSSVATRTSGAVTVRVRTESPHVSLQIAEGLLDGLNQFNRVTRQTQAGAERRFIEGRLNEARASLRAAEDALQRFLQSNRQFTSPQLSFQQDRLERDVALQQQVVTALAQQYEDARIREVRDTPVITVIEQPTLPVLPDPRGRVILVSVFTIVALMLGAIVVLTREGWRRQSAGGSRDPSFTILAGEWQRVRGMFRPR